MDGLTESELNFIQAAIKGKPPQEAKELAGELRHYFQRKHKIEQRKVPDFTQVSRKDLMKEMFGSEVPPNAADMMKRFRKV